MEERRESGEARLILRDQVPGGREGGKAHSKSTTDGNNALC